MRLLKQIFDVATNPKTTLLKRLVVLYGVFAVSHLLFKLALIWYRLRSKLKFLKHLPGAQHDVFASELVANTHRFNKWRCESLEQYRDAPLVRSPGPEVELICNTPETVEFLLKTGFKQISKMPVSDDYGFFLLGEFAGKQGIFVLPHGNVARVEKENEMWFAQRKTASKIFTKSNFSKLMAETFEDKVDVLIETLKDGQPVDMEEKFFCFTFDSIQKIFFNRTIDTVSGERDEYTTAFDDAHRSMIRHAFQALSFLVVTEIILPYPFGAMLPKHYDMMKWNNPMFSLFRQMHPEYREFRRNVDFLDRRTLEMIRDTRQDPHMSTRRDLIANFINSDKDLSDEQLVDVVKSMVLAGRDTSACTLTWLFYSLTQNPDVQERLCEEVDRVLQGKKPTLEDLHPDKMPYLNGVLFETLRLYPPVPEDQKVTLEPVTFPDGTVVPPGVSLLFIPYTMGRDPKRYPDPLHFNPERWIPFQEPSQYEFPVFQAGNRICLGKDMAKFEVKMVTASLLQQFTFTLDDDPKNITEALMLTMALANKPDHSSHKLLLVPQARHK